MIRLIKLKDGTLLLSEVENITPYEYGGPNTKLTNPYQLPMNKRWLIEFTEQTVFMIDDTDILTLANPRIELLDEYKKTNGIEEVLDFQEIDQEDGDEIINEDV